MAVTEEQCNKKKKKQQLEKIPKRAKVDIKQKLFAIKNVET